MTKPSTQPVVFEMVDAHWHALRKSGNAHKHLYGHAAVVSGPAGQGGAARLAARGALRIGAGLVSIVCAPDAVAEHSAQLNAIMVKPFSAETNLLEHLIGLRPQAICIGPNLGLGLASQTLLMHTLSFALPTCFDADAITLVANPSLGLPAITNSQSVLTPHEGELRRLIPEMFAKTSCRVSLAQAAATKVRCVVLFKGSKTVIAAPDHVPAIVSSKSFQSASWLATAGSGDVLAGFITGLLARGFGGFEAASIATDLHFRCADAFGPGLIAEDIPEMLPRVFEGPHDDVKMD